QARQRRGARRTSTRAVLKKRLERAAGWSWLQNRIAACHARGAGPAKTQRTYRSDCPCPSPELIRGIVAGVRVFIVTCRAECRRRRHRNRRRQSRRGARPRTQLLWSVYVPLANNMPAEFGNSTAI